MVIIDIESNTSLGGLTLDPAGMHCPAGDDASLSSFTYLRTRYPTLELAAHRKAQKVYTCLLIYSNCRVEHRLSKQYTTSYRTTFSK